MRNKVESQVSSVTVECVGSILRDCFHLAARFWTPCESLSICIRNIVA